MVDFFDTLAGRAPDVLVGWRAGSPVRHEAFVLRARAWAALARRTAGANVALFLDDAIDFAAALLGAWQAGKTVWLTADTLPASCESLGRSVDAFFGEFPAGCRPAMPAEGDRCALPWQALAPEFAGLFVHTSGSTGAAQAIPKRMSQLTSEVANLEAQFGSLLGEGGVVATVSHQHIYGLLFTVLWPLAQGRAIPAQRMDQPEALAQALGQRPCVLVASPAHLKRLPAHLDWRAAARELRAVFSSGGPLGHEAALGVAALLGHAPIEVYGSSETGGIAWRQCQPDSVPSWRALPGVEWRAGADGMLEVRSPHAGGAGSGPTPGPDPEPGQGRWLQLADRIEATGDGRFLLHGRSDRIVKVEEKRVSLDAIEAALAGSGLAAEARVMVDQQAPGRRQALAAFVVLSPAGRSALEADGKLAMNQRLRTLLRDRVEAVAIPRRWRYLDRLPIDAQGKTTHAQLSALLAEDGEARPRLPAVRVIEVGPARVLLELTVPPNLFYFEGHFPLAPVLPGVVQVDWAIQYGRAHFALAPVFRGIQALKFQKVIQSACPVQLELVHDTAKSSLNFRYFSEAGAHAGGRILFGTA